MFFGKDRRGIKNILIVEDEPLVAFDTEHMLTHNGYTIVDTVDSYEDVVVTLAEDTPDLIVADIKLTGDKSGIDVARLADGRGIPVLFVSGHCPLPGQQLGVGCLAKPYGQRDLIQAIRAVDLILRGKSPGRLPPALTLYIDA